MEIDNNSELGKNIEGADDSHTHGSIHVSSTGMKVNYFNHTASCSKENDPCISIAVTQYLTIK